MARAEQVGAGDCRDCTQSRPGATAPHWPGSGGTRAGSRGWLLWSLDPRLRRPALVIEVDDGPGRPGARRDDGAHPGGTAWFVHLQIENAGLLKLKDHGD